MPLRQGEDESSANMREGAEATSLPPCPTPHPYAHAEPSCGWNFWACCQKGEAAPGAPGGWDLGKTRGGGLHWREGAPVCSCEAEDLG